MHDGAPDRTGAQRAGRPRVSLRKGGARPVRAGEPSDAAGGAVPAADVGAFRQGSPLSQWTLARYLVGRAIAESAGRALLVVAIGVLVLAALSWLAGAQFWSVVVGIVGVAVLGMRALLLGLLRRLSVAGTYAPLDARLRALVADTRADVLRELRRLGLPGRTWTLPLLGLRLARRRTRAATMDRLGGFDIDRAVPAARLDELHLLLRSATGRGPL
jgi:hypothetical protein